MTVFICVPHMSLSRITISLAPGNEREGREEGWRRRETERDVRGGEKERETEGDRERCERRRERERGEKERGWGKTNKVLKNPATPPPKKKHIYK